jgi:addiction module HigA family antidote
VTLWLFFPVYPGWVLAKLVKKPEPQNSNDGAKTILPNDLFTFLVSAPAMKTDQAIYSDMPIPPGEYLEEVLDELGMTKDELAKRMNRPAPKLSAIFKGEKAITPDTALQLEKVVGVPAHIWTGLESEYRLTLIFAFIG